MNKIRDFKKRGKTIIFVSHDLGTISHLCNRAIWLNYGQISARGTTQRVIDYYRDSVHSTEEARLEKDHITVEETLKERWGSKEVEITKLQFFDKSGEETHGFRTGDPFKVKISYKAYRRIEKPVFGAAIHRNDGTA